MHNQFSGTFFNNVPVSNCSSYFRKGDRAVSRDFLGKLFFEMVIFPYRHHVCLGVRKLIVLNTSDPVKTYSVESNL